MIDFDKLEQDILEGAVQGLHRGAKLVARRAKARAPVRNIFGNRYAFRAKTGGELAADFGAMSPSALQKMLTEGPGAFTQRWKGPKNLSKQGLAQMGQREQGRAEELLELYDAGDESPLTRRGASEVRTGRAAFSIGGKTTIGGRLRGEIYATKPSGVGDEIEAWVISPTPYAKYQEFGTRHNRAHPFLRPALEESREDIKSLVSQSVAQAVKKSAAKSVQLEIKVTL